MFKKRNKRDEFRKIIENKEIIGTDTWLNALLKYKSMEDRISFYTKGIVPWLSLIISIFALYFSIVKKSG